MTLKELLANKDKPVILCICLTLLITCLTSFPGIAAPPTDALHLYLDADLSGASASAISIEQGIKTALSENDNKLAGRHIKLIKLNHRGNSARSLANLKKFLADPQAIALFSGLHSPPLLAHRQFINDNKILVLDPWAAAGPITRPPNSNNWIFRLSIDDTKAGSAIVKRAINERHFKNPALLLENTGWGQSNLKTMTAALKKQGIAPTTVYKFDWGLKEAGAKILLRNIKKSGADVIFLVANAPEAKSICKGMYELHDSARLPIVSHWGLTGGDFPQVINLTIRNKLDLEFIQTNFSFLDMKNKSFPNKVFTEAAKLFPSIEKPTDIKAPTGFIHAYDLTKLLIAAANQTDMTGDKKTISSKIHHSLENLNQPVQGLIKTYIRPFRPYTIKDKDAHEALNITNFTFGKYGDQNEIILIRK